jgi:hypothetical protein
MTFEAWDCIMNRPLNDPSDSIDHITSRSICDAVGERLRKNVKPEALEPSSHLQHLMDELRKRDEHEFSAH